MFDNIEKHQTILKMASSTMDTGYEAQGYTTTTTSNGNNATIYNIVDTHDEYEKKIIIKTYDGYEDRNEYYIDYEDVYNNVKNDNIKLSEDNLFYKNCVSSNHNDNNILRDELAEIHY